jgi:hypothetical protein
MNPGIHGALFAAAKKKKEEEEEERMTQYNTNDLEGWEFKIVRSALGRFGNSEVVGKLISEEAQNGWEMVEKFDNYRIRFKRRTDKRSLHSGGSIDPYRTSYGVGGTAMPLIAVTVAMLLGLAMLVFDKSENTGSVIMPAIVIGVILLLVITMIVIKRR